jgi:hypothetical protein
VNYVAKSAPVKITVDPLPSGAPADFKGAVGRFSMRSTADKTTTKTNEPISLKVIISGTGNVKLLESPEVELPKDFEQYSPKVSDKINRDQERISGTKTFEYLLIPRYPGRKVIKPVSFSYFDLAKREYVNLKSDQLELDVEQGPASAAPLAVGGSREDIRLLSQDIRFIKVAHHGFARPGEYLHTSAAFIVLLLLPLGGMAIAFLFARQRQVLMADEASVRYRRAAKIAQKGLKNAERLLKANAGAGSQQRLAFYAEVSSALYKYLGSKLNIQPAEMSIEGALAELAKRSVDGERSASLKSLLELCEMARFAPTSLNVSAMQQTYDQAKQLITDLERTMKSS